MSRSLRFLISCILFGSWGALPLHAQLTTDSSLTVQQLVTSLIGSGVDVSNLTITCDTAVAMRQFNGVNSNLGLATGLLMSTGVADSAGGANNFTNASVGGNLGFPGYAPLSTLSGQNTFDACVIEFDIVPYCDSIGIRYVFASEEYHEYVSTAPGGGINDAFAFFISGPGFAAPAPGDNIALIPGTTTPVSINNVNNGFAGGGQPATGPCNNCNFFVDNVGGLFVEYDGMTTPLLAAAAVTPCQTYHITLAIADASDGILDSGVFLEAEGIGCITPLLDLEVDNLTPQGDDVLVESCISVGLATFTLPEAPTDTTYFALTYGGTATMGVDYLNLPDSILFNPGQISYVMPITVFGDALAEGEETLVIRYEDSTVCGNLYRDSVTIFIRDFPDAAVLDTTLCLGADSLSVGLLPSQPGFTYQWQGSGLSDSTVAQPFYSYANVGMGLDTQQLVLTVASYPGVCQETDTGQLIFTAPADVQLFTTPTDGCVGDSLLFSFTSPDSVLPQQWLFGDGTQSLLPQPLHSYAVPDTYSYLLSLTDTFGCVSSVQDSLIIAPTPDAAFTVESVCLGSSSAFTLTGGPQPGLQYQWTFGDGNGLDVPAPTHLYDSAGTYAVTLVVTNGFGCSDTATGLTTVSPGPTAAIEAADVCVHDLALLISQSQAGTAAIDSLLWQINGGTALGDSLSVQFAAPGLQVVSLTVIDQNGCQDNATDSLRVFPAPQAQFAPDSLCLGDTLFLQDSSISSTPLQNWAWTFGDGNQASGPAPAHLYQGIGSYQVTLAVADQRGCRDTLTRPVVVSGPPDPSFAHDPTCDGVPVQFAVDPPPPGHVFLWDMGDGSTYQEGNVSHLYPGPGRYPVQLVVRNRFGCADSSQDTAEVYRLPVSEFAAEAVCQGQPVAFVNQSQPGSFPLAEYDWSFGDNTPTSRVENPVHVYQGFGLLPVTLLVKDTFGCEADTTELLQIWARPRVAFDVDTVCAGVEMVLRDRSLSPDGSQLQRWRWDLGNGLRGEGRNIRTQYEAAGRYAVELLVVSEHGCRDSLTRTNLVYPLPQLAFTHEPVCALDTTYFEATVAGGSNDPQDGVATWQWDWGDGQQSGSLLAPGHLYAAPGAYLVQLSATSRRGCANVVEELVSVYRRPELPRLLPDTVCFGQTGFLAAVPQDPEDVVRWYRTYPDSSAFYQGETYLTPPLTAAQRYYVEAVSRAGCRSPRGLLTAALHPDAAPTLLADAEVVERPDALVNFQVASQVPMASYRYDFGDGNVATQPQPAHTFAQPGFYRVQVSLTDENGCTYTDERTVEIKQLINLLVPSAFTPNADGVNDQFFIGQTLLRSVDFVVFNRWGRPVFESNQLDLRWDGRDLKGQPVPEGVYAYRLIARDLDGRIIRKVGSITLLR